MSKAIPAQRKPVSDEATIDTGRPWPFRVSIGRVPFAGRGDLDITVTVDGPMTFDEAESLGVLLVATATDARAAWERMDLEGVL